MTLEERLRTHTVSTPILRFAGAKTLAEPTRRAATRARRAGRAATMAIAVAALALPTLGLPSAARAFGLDDVTARAQALAREPYRDHRRAVPEWMLAGRMSYDQWRDIRFRGDRALWKKEGLPFQVQFFHPGLHYDRSVRVHVVEGTTPREIPFDIHSFDYGRNDFASRIPKDVGWAGLRLHAPLRRADYFDEVLVFLGATYLRGVGRDNVYGLSARGIAIDTVEPTGEEFPHFVELWLVRPAPGAPSLTVMALMEGPSVTGAYRFDVRPGEATEVDVEARLFARRDVRKLGIAPLTSMFFHGENTKRRFDDFRPEVHDSDGLLAHFESGEWLWRPLDNPTRIHASGLATSNPRGFGLLQRDRAFASYQDIETRAELRPSAWVRPKGEWGRGRVELVEIPTGDEFVDNVVAYWVPAEPVKAGSRRDYAYTLSFFRDDSALSTGGRVLGTRRDGGEGGAAHRYVVDFVGRGLEALGDDAVPEAVLSASPAAGARILEHHVVRNPDTKGWRLTFRIDPSTSDPVEMRAFLKNAKGVLTETWSAALVE